MFHLLRAVAVIGAAAGLAWLTYWAAGKVMSWRLPRSVVAGLAAAGLLTLWVATVRHAALAASAAQPAGNGQKLSPGAILADGFAGVFIVVTAAVYIAVTVLAVRRDRRAKRRGAAPAARRRRGPARGWGKA